MENKAKSCSITTKIKTRKDMIKPMIFLTTAIIKKTKARKQPHVRKLKCKIN